MPSRLPYRGELVAPLPFRPQVVKDAAALRLGFCVAPPWVVQELEKVVLPYHLAAPTQLAGVLALDFGAEMDKRVAMLVRERERLRAELDAVEGVTALPSGANFVLVRVHGDGHGLWPRLVYHIPA